MRTELEPLNYDRFHLVGIGGIGLSAVAQILKSRGKTVTGSDIKRSYVIEKLESLGIRVFLGHRPDNLNNAQVLVFSSAISEDNPELITAQNMGLPILHRAQMLSSLLKNYKIIAVTGNYGKSTTTAMIGHILTKLKGDPLVVVGAWLKGVDSNVRLGNDNVAVIEADESDASLLHIKPELALVSSLGADVNINSSAFRQLGYDMKAIEEKLKQVMIEFIGKAKYTALGQDAAYIAQYLDTPYTTYGWKGDCLWRLDDVELSGMHSRAKVFYKGKHVFDLELNVPGKYNLLNALGAVALLAEWYDPREVVEAFVDFELPRRRFDVLLNTEEVMIVDDYAHNPEKLKALLTSVKDAFPERRVIAIFQPHRYTRTLMFGPKLVDALKLADIVILTPIYSAGEAPIEGISSEVLAQQLRLEKHADVFTVNSLLEAKELVLNLLEGNDIVLTIGAGNIRIVAEQLAEHIR